MNYANVNPKMKDMILDGNILSKITVINNLKVPILININSNITHIKSKHKIINILRKNPVKLLFRLPKVQNNKTNFTDGKDFEIILNINDINNFDFKKYILSHQEINNFYYRYIKQNSY